MDILHAKYIKIVAAGGNLGAATERSLTKEKIAVSDKGVLAEHTLSTNPNPVARHEIGTEFSVKGVLGQADEELLPTLLGGTTTSNVWTKVQGIRTLTMYDIEIGVYRATDGLIVKHTLTDMNFMPEAEFGHEQTKRTYLPFTLMSTATSDHSIDNSAA